MKLEFVFIIACVPLLVLGHSSAHYVVDDEHHNTTTVEDDLELEKQLKLVNKPPIKTIVTAEGDIYDCVDINKQPALDNPLLKGHKVQLKPSSLPIGMFDDNKSSIEVGLPDGGCPLGTVPLRRFTKENLLRIKSSPVNKDDIHHPLISNSKGYMPMNKEWAALRTKDGQSFYGALAFFVVYGLTEITKDQFSTSIMWIANNVDPENEEYITAGWSVQPEFYGDSKSRLTTFWTRDNGKSTGCPNTECGFVQISRKIPLGLALKPVSTIGGVQYGFHLLVFKDPNTKDWMLVFGKGEVVGYWPSELFDKLADNANRLQFGGLIGHTQWAKKPKLGNGIYPSDDNHDACFITQIKGVAKNKQLFDIGWNQADPYETSPDCYRINRNKYYMFYYGGPGPC